MHGKKAEDVKVCGDFFGIAPIEELEREILSCYPDGVDNIEMPVEKYIFGMNKNNLVELLKGDSI